jgi:hypothetical protein
VEGNFVTALYSMHKAFVALRAFISKCGRKERYRILFQKKAGHRYPDPAKAFG